MARHAVLVLLYHRVAEADTDPQKLAVHPDRFARHLQHIRATADVLSLDEVQRGLENGRLPARGLAVTFDDGYADNLEQAVPPLTAARVPASFFVTTGPVESAREYWWDELEQALLQPGDLPGVLRLPLDGRTWEASLGSAARWTGRDAARHASWTVEDPDPTPRHSAYRALCAALKPLAGPARTRALDELTSRTGRPRQVRASHRPMTASEVARLAHMPGMTVGSHSVSHPSLAALPVEVQREELTASRAALERMTGRAVTHLAFPFGGRADHSWRTRRAARAAGYTLACANEAGLVRRKGQAFRLPRVLVRDWDAATFAQHVDRWFDA